MSRVLIVFAHPSHKSYDFGILEKVIQGLQENGNELEVNDLYALQFDPLMTEEELYRKSIPEMIAGEQRKILWAELLIFIFPVWWWGPPAILKGWLERVLCLDFALRYDLKQNGFIGMLRGRQAVIITTGSSDPNSYAVNWQAESHTRYLGDILAMTGLTVIKQMNLYNIHQFRSPSELGSGLSEIYDFAKGLTANVNA